MNDRAWDLLIELTEPEAHYYCEDCWYSCPKATERDGSSAYCGESPKVCDCGADERNAKRAELRSLLGGPVDNPEPETDRAEKENPQP